MISMQEAANKLGLSLSTVRRRVYSGEIPAANMGSEIMPRWRIDEQELKEYVDERRNRKGTQ